MSKGTHEYRPDPRNREILIYVNGEHVPREEATVSVFDSGFVLGDGIREGLRVHHGHIAFLDAHLDRLYEGAKALDLDIGLDTDVYGAEESFVTGTFAGIAPVAEVDGRTIGPGMRAFDGGGGRRGRSAAGGDLRFRRSPARKTDRRRPFRRRLGQEAARACTGGGQAPGLNPQATNRIAWPARSPARAGP